MGNGDEKKMLNKIKRYEKGNKRDGQESEKINENENWMNYATLFGATTWHLTADKNPSVHGLGMDEKI